MKQQLGKLGVREYISIAILMVGAKATEDTPTHLFSKVQNASWMIPILSAGIFFIPLFLLLKTLTLYPRQRFIFRYSKITWKIPRFYGVPAYLFD